MTLLGKKSAAFLFISYQQGTNFLPTKFPIGPLWTVVYCTTPANALYIKFHLWEWCQIVPPGRDLWCSSQSSWHYTGHILCSHMLRSWLTLSMWFFSNQDTVPLLQLEFPYSPVPQIFQGNLQVSNIHSPGVCKHHSICQAKCPVSGLEKRSLELSFMG